ncbi:MAG: hypothetical protein DWQ37_01395 [Planctomycetota bacterium]|nr:MAG: hypothetical protein DWQ37_01395 [Planctomycetota bacterium]
MEPADAEEVPPPAVEQETPAETLPELPTTPSEPGEGPSELVPPFDSAPPTPPADESPLVPPFGSETPDDLPFEEPLPTPSMDDAPPTPPDDLPGMVPPLPPSQSGQPSQSPQTESDLPQGPATQDPAPFPNFPLEDSPAPSDDPGDPFQDDPEPGVSPLPGLGQSGASNDDAPPMLLVDQEQPELLPAQPQRAPVAVSPGPRVPDSESVSEQVNREEAPDQLEASPSGRVNPLRVGSSQPRSLRPSPEIRATRFARPAAAANPTAFRSNPLRK